MKESQLQFNFGGVPLHWINVGELKIPHYSCEDRWYSCPLSEEGCHDERQDECNCGAEVHNKLVDNMQEKIDLLIIGNIKKGVGDNG